MKAYAVSKTNKKANVVGVRAGDSSVAERTGLACENLDSILSTLKKTQSQQRMLNDQVSNYGSLVSRLPTTSLVSSLTQVLTSFEKVGRRGNGKVEK